MNSMTDHYLSANFAGRILIFSVIFTSIEAVLFGQLSAAIIGFSFISGILLALVLGSIFIKLPFKLGVRIGTAWLALFIIQYFSNLFEAYFFTTVFPTMLSFLAGVLESLVITFVEALLVGILFVPREIQRSYVSEIKSYFAQRSGFSWTLRIIVGSIIYFPIYLVFGGLVSPFVIPYYTDPSMGLMIPGFDVMTPVELVRGFLYVLALLPIIAGIRIKRGYLYVAIASLLYVLGAFMPLLTNLSWPVQLRIFHGLEILGDFLVYGAALAYLFGPPRKT